jgi:hypothetical protein
MNKLHVEVSALTTDGKSCAVGESNPDLILGRDES